WMRVQPSSSSTSAATASKYSPFRPSIFPLSSRCERRLRAGEFLDAVVAAVGDEDVAARIHRDAYRISELADPAAEATPRGDEDSDIVEYLDAVAAEVDDEDGCTRIHPDALNTHELAVPAAGATP